MEDQPKKLHLGCGLNTPEGWIHVDGSWNAWWSKYPVARRVIKIFHLVPASQLDLPWNPNILVHDVRKPLPFKNDSVHAIYASHLLEHLYLNEARHLLKECFRVLQPRCVLRMVVPDLRAIVLEYLDKKLLYDLPGEAGMSSPADRLNYRLLLRTPNPPSGSVPYKIYTALKDFQSHKWMYDADSLSQYFKQAGFVDAQEKPFRQSLIEGIDKIEQADRVLNGAGICVEGVKPDNR